MTASPLVLATAVFVAAACSSGAGPDEADGDGEAIPYFLPESVPAEFRLANLVDPEIHAVVIGPGVDDPSNPSDPASQGEVLVYANPTLADPFDGPYVSVVTTEITSLDPYRTAPAEPAEVGGQEAWLAPAAGPLAADSRLGRSLVWIDERGAAVEVIGREYSDDELLDLAEQVVVDRGRAVFPREVLGAEFAVVGHIYDRGVSPHNPAHEAWSTLLYTNQSLDDLSATDPPDGTEDVRSFTVGIGHGDGALVAGLRAALVESHSITIDGREAMVGTTGRPGSRPFITLAWVEEDLTVGVIAASGIPEAEVIRIAESVAPVSADAWNQLRRRLFEEQADFYGERVPDELADLLGGG